MIRLLALWLMSASLIVFAEERSLYRVDAVFLACDLPSDATSLAQILTEGTVEQQQAFALTARSCFALRPPARFTVQGLAPIGSVSRVKLSDGSLVWAPSLVIDRQRLLENL